MNDFTFLTEEQCFGKNKLDILKKYGNECAVTDFSILLGYNMGLHNNYTSEGNSLKNRSCVWWTKTPDDEGVCVVDKRGNRNCYDVDYRAFGARPALPYSSISQISSNAVRGRNGILEVEYGEYPQTIVSEKLSSKLETAYVNMKHMNTGMKETGKKYTTNLNSKYIKPRTPFEYEYNGKNI